MLAVATVVPAFIVSETSWLFTIMISVCPLVESWIKVGTTSRWLEDDSGMGRSSAMQGSLMSCLVVGEKSMQVLVRLFGGKVSVRILEKRSLFEDSSSV